MSSESSSTEKLEFRAELKQLLHLITHSLYSNKEIFLRELISNASDAINKIKFDSLQHEERLEGNKDWKIKITVDQTAGTLIISDNGIGMNRDTAVENLGTIARSGTRAYMEILKNQEARTRPELIGQFGVGFYSAFMVADRVTVLSRMAGDAREGVRWESDGQGDFTVEAYEKALRGTDVILHLKKEEKDFLEPFRLRQIIKKFSDFIEHPVVMDVEKESDGKKVIEEETVNARKAIWLRNKSENTDEEYKAFYKQISHDFRDPARWIHYTAEGNQEFRVLVFLPAEKPFEMQMGGDYDWGLKLYIQRVLIMDHCEALLPSYLRFAKGVVDSADLPLNISRELLQDNPLLEQIRNNVTRSILKALEDLKGDDYEKYVSFFKEFGTILKEGPRSDWNNRERIADLFLFESLKTPSGQFTTLAKYLESMPADQKEIYYLTGETRQQLENSPYLETYRSKGWDVLLLTDPVDEFVIPELRYKEKSFSAVDRAEQGDGGVSEEEKVAHSKLLESLKTKLSDVADVRLTSRLTESACVLVTEGHMSAHMERLLHRWGKGEEAGSAKRILEINPAHPAIRFLKSLADSNTEDPRIENYGRLLLDQAVIAEGSRIKDPVSFARRINDLIVAAGLRS
ncbi:MAG: molecular chaperone HtpG [Gemmataceae bacterium]